MDQEILLHLIAQRVDPSKFYLRGLTVKWIKDNDAVEYRTTINDVLANYETLAAQYLDSQEAIRQAAAAQQAAKKQAIETILPSREKVHTAINNISSLAEAKAFLLKLSDVVYWWIKNSDA